MPDFGSFRGFGEKLVQGQTPTNLGIIGSIMIPDFLLDFYPNASAAYSVRKLSAINSVNAIRVRRSSDNAEQDIGFTLSGDLDTSALTAFCSGTNGFVTTWYDQSGNARNATQTTAANQPQIVSSGTILNLNNKSTVNFNAKSLNFTGFGSDNFTIISVIKATTISNFSGYIHNIAAGFNGFKIVSRQASTWQSMFLKYNGTSETSNSRRNDANSISGSQYLENWIFPNNPALLYENNVSKTVSSSIGSGWGNNAQSAIGALGYDTGLYGNFDIQEMIIYSSNQDNNISAINTNINTYYGIY